MLCCRGSHRKLIRAKWLCSLQNVHPEPTRPSEAVATTSKDPSRRNASCGPSTGIYRLPLPDPVDCWLSTYRQLQRDNISLQTKIAAKKSRLSRCQARPAKQVAAHRHPKQERKNILRPRPPTLLRPHESEDVAANRRVDRLLERLCEQIIQHSLAD